MSSRARSFFFPPALVALYFLLPAFGVCGVCGVSYAKSIVPPYERITTRNGVEIYFFPSPNIPLFQVELGFDAGGDLDPAGRSGLGQLGAAMIRRGTEGLNEDEISRRIDDLAAGINISMGSEQTSVGAYGLNEHAPRILDLFFRILASPSFPSAPFLRLKTNLLDHLKQLPDSPGALGAHVLNAVVFNGTEQGRPLAGLRRELKTLQLEEARAHVRELLRTDRLKVLVIGGKDRSAILDPVVKGIEALGCPACGKPLPPVKRWRYRAWELPADRVLIVRRKGLTEAHVLMGFQGPRRDIPEFYDLRVAETILSGYFGSKLNQEIREKRNLTYSISADFDFGKNFGAFTVTSGTRNEKVGEMIEATRGLLGDFRAGLTRGGMTEEDMKDSQDYLVGSFPLGMQNLYAIAQRFFSGTMIGLKPEFIDVYRDRIRGVTLESLKAAVRKYFLLEQMKTVVVGDPEILGPRLREKGLQYVVREPADFL